MMKLISSKYYLKLILFSLLISTLPVAFIGIFSYNSASGMIQSKVNEGNMQILTQTQISVEQPLRQIDNSMLQFLMSGDLPSTISSIQIPMDYDKVNGIANGLNRLNSEDIKLEEVALICIEKNIGISSHDLYYLDQLQEKSQFLKLGSDPKYSFWSKWKGPIISGSNVSSEDSVGVVLVRKIMPIYYPGTPPFIITKIPSSEINKYINDSKLGDIMIVDSNFNVIASKDAAMLGKDLSQTVYGKKISSMGDSSKSGFSDVVGGNRVVVNYLKSDYNGWIYVSTTPENVITRDSRSIGFVTFFTCLVIMVIIILVSFFGTQKIYSPIHKLYETVSSDSAGGVTGKDELKYLGDRIHNMVSNQTLLTKQLKSQSEKIKEYYLTEMLLGEVKSEEINDKLQFLGFDTLWGHMGVLILEIDTLDGSAFSADNKDLVMFAINNVVCELVPETNRLSLVKINQSYAVVIGSSHDLDETFSNYAVSQANMIQRVIKEYLNIKVSIGISRPFTELSQVHKAYMEAVDALKHKLMFGSEAIIDIDDIQRRQAIQTGISWKLEDELLCAVKLSDREKADKLLTSLIDEIFRNNPSYIEFQASLGMLMMDLIRIAQSLGMTAKELFGKEEYLFEKFIEFRTQGEVEKWFRQSLINPIMQLQDERRRSQQQKISDEIIKMIHEQHDKDLSLELCAERLNYNPKHVSRVFKQETGISFSDYLAQYRLEVAKKLLKETDMKISDIAEKLQYQNAQNFIRYFRKIEGITPGQYRGNN